MNNELKNKIIYEVYWYGPYDPDCLENVHPNNVLYMICGTYGLYGRNVPLYIGKTERSIQARLNEHHTWIEDEPDPVKVYTAVIGKFLSWSHNSNIEEYPPLDRSVIEAAESLLIYSHQPVYNQRSKARADQLFREIRLFNTGHRSTLYPEISGRYYVGG